MTAEVVVHIPTWDEADRIRKAMRDAGVGVQELADELEVSRTSVSNWINGRNSPRDRDVRAIARLTGVPALWIRDGEGPAVAGRASRHRYAPRDLNPEPTVSGVPGPRSCGDTHLTGVQNITPRHVTQRRPPRAA